MFASNGNLFATSGALDNLQSVSLSGSGFGKSCVSVFGG